MIKYLSFIVGALILAKLESCHQTAPIDSNLKHLYQRWMHSHEEDGQNYQVFRPANFNFPPSRGRTGFELDSLGHGYWGAIAPTDGIVWRDASWSIDADSVIKIKVLKGPKSHGFTYSYRIREATNDRLILVFLDQESHIKD